MDQLKTIYKRYLEEKCTEEELKMLLQHFEIEDQPDKLADLIDNALLNTTDSNTPKPAYIGGMLERNHDKIHRKIEASSKHNRGKLRKLIITVSAAASIAVVGLFAYLKLPMDKDTASLVSNVYEEDIVPGTNRATLSFSDGKVVALDENQEAVQVQGDVISYVDGTTLVGAEEVQQLIVSTPRAGQYQVRLPDGSKVWLNSESQIEFPSEFVTQERKVRVRGEVYFEVAKDISKPFRVQVEDTEVEALGTAFNINTHIYKSKVKTILTEGKIRVSSEGKSTTISPGYEVVSGQGNLEVAVADLEEAVAWKDGYFYFNSKRLNEVLADVARWYDVDVDIRVPLSDKRYVGGIKKSESIQAVCAVLSGLTSQTVVVEGQTIIVK